MFVQWNGKQGVFVRFLISVESFIRAESAPGGQMWSHGATTNTEWIQRCNQTFFILKISCPDCILPFRNPSNTIQHSVCNDCTALVSHEKLHKEFSYNSCGILLLSLFKSDIFSLLFWAKNRFNFHFQLSWCNPAFTQWLLRSHYPFLCFL